MKFREFSTSSKKIVLAGKDENSNEDLVNQSNPDEFVFHTAASGSPFVNIKSPQKDVTKKYIKEAAIFCASRSQDWRDNKNDVEVHYFLGKDIFKEHSMKKGTFGVKKFKSIKVKKEDIERLNE